MTEQGCSDGDCRLRLTPVTGQHTNARCSCLRDIPTQTRIAIQRKLQHQMDEIKRLQQENNEVGAAIACAADLMNTWAREASVPECTDPWSGTALRDLVDRLWSYSTRKAAKEK